MSIVLVLAACAAARPSIDLPGEIYAVPGRETSVYYRNVTDAVRPEAYRVVAGCAVGADVGDRWSWKPGLRDAGRRERLVLTLCSDAGALSSATTTVVVARPPRERGQTLTLATLGDSLANCLYHDSLLGLMRANGFARYRPVGSRTGGSAAPVGEIKEGFAPHDCYGGYTSHAFLNRYAFCEDEIDNTQAAAERDRLVKDGLLAPNASGWRRNLLKSPLVRVVGGRKVVDVQAWFDRINNGLPPDVILIELGSNDIFGMNDDGRDSSGGDPLAVAETNLVRLVDALRAAAPRALVGLVSVPPGGRQPAFAANYGCRRTDFTFRSSALAYSRMQRRLVASRGDPLLVTVPVHHDLDVATAYPENNALHLTRAGGDQMGKSLAAWLEHVLEVKPGRPYEMTDAGRDRDEVAPWIDFEKDSGWRARAPAGGTAVAYVSDERRTFGERALGVHFRGAAEVRVEPPKPLATPTKDFEWFGGWIWSDQGNYGYMKKIPVLTYGLVFSSADGSTTNIPLQTAGRNSVMGWQGWHYVARRFTPGELKLLRGDGVRFAGFYLDGATNDIPRDIYFDNLAFFRRDEKTPLSFDPIPDIQVPSRPDAALPDSMRPGGRNSTRRDGDATVFSYEGPDGRLEYIWRGSPGTLEARWNGGPAFRPAACAGAVDRPGDAKYEASIRGKTLVVDVSAPAGESLVSLGRPDGAKVLSRTAVPSFGDGYGATAPRSLVTALEAGGANLFALSFADWYLSHATRMASHEDSPGVVNGACSYEPKTDGVRNPVSERLYVTVSPEFMETLPVIANPPSPWRAKVGSHAWCAYASSEYREFDKAFWRGMHRYGLRNVVVNDHECCMRDDGESFTFRDKAAPRKGGDAGMRDYADCLIRELGYLYGPYNNFTDFAPVNANWSIDRACRESSGGLVPAWIRCYAPKPHYAAEACRRYAPALARKFGFNTAYCDVHTAVLPWEYVDCDARVPGAAMFRTTYMAYAALLLEQKKAWKGPVYSEGGSQFYYAGICDGNYAQLRINPAKDPWIVDFDLRRIHPLNVDFGCGNLAMFSKEVKGDTDSQEFEAGVDWFQAATLAFGHSPYLLVEAMFDPRHSHARGYRGQDVKYVPEAGLPFALRSYYMLCPVSARYATAEAEEILYLCDDGEWRGVSGAVLHGGTVNQVAVRYSDGTRVVANGDRSRRLKSSVFGRDFDLPPCGYAAWSADGVLEMSSSDAGGARTDYCAWADGVYFDTRASEEARVYPKARGRGIAVCRREGPGWEVIPVKGECAFRVDGARAVALDRGRRELGPASLVRDSGGYVAVAPVKGAFSYLVLPR